MEAKEHLSNHRRSMVHRSWYGGYMAVFFVLLTATQALQATPNQSPLDEVKEQEYSLGVVPQQSATRTARMWGPILRYLSEESGVKLRLGTAPSIPEFEQRLEHGEYDFAYMNPYHYTVFHDSVGYLAFARQERKEIKGIIVVNKQSPIKDISELSGLDMAFPAPLAFAATLLPKAFLRQEGVEVKSHYVSSHDSVYRAVASGVFQVGGGIIRTLRNSAPEVNAKLRVLWESQAYSPHPFTAHPRVDVEVVDLLRQAMMHMNTSDEGRRLLESVKFTGITEASDREWDDVRELGIGSFIKNNK